MLSQLLFKPTTAQAVLVLSLSIVSGLALGRVRIGSVRLGVGGVLFSSLALGHFGFAIEHHILEFAREFGLILFVYSVGMQVGPGFLDSCKRAGLRLNLMAAGIVLAGALITVACFLKLDIPLAVAVGVFCGAVTNTPALAAATQTFLETLPDPAQAAEAVRLAGLGYAVAYPFGIFGIILTMLLVRLAFRIDVPQETRDMEAAQRAGVPELRALTVEVANAGLDGRTLGSLGILRGLNLAISRVREPGGNREIHAATEATVLRPGMLLHGVGDAQAIDQFQALFGPASSIDLSALQGPLEVKRLQVTKESAAGKSLSRLSLTPDRGVTVTRLLRSGVELAARPDTELHFGDSVRVVADARGMAYAEGILGNSVRALETPHVAQLFVGILAGIALGSIPVFIPGLPSALKLGLAGGPLLVAILLSRLHSVAGMTCYMSVGANLMVREIGITLFLSCVGLNAGAGFLKALLDGSGLYWMGVGALVTGIPLLLAAFFGRLVLRCNYASLCGLLAGSMTDPPALAFANQMLGSDAAASVYATVYPLTMILRIVAGQVLVILLAML